MTSLPQSPYRSSEVNSMKTRKRISGSFILCCALIVSHALAAEPETIRIRSSITRVQPMTGIVLWTDNDKVNTDAIQLEYRYCGYDEVVDANGNYDFGKIDKVLDEVAARKHQAILRFYYEYVGKETTAPRFIKSRADYKETVGKSERKTTHFCDWSNESLKQFTIDFYTKFAERYDRDPRIAFLQTGFGLWAEYHIYDGPKELGNQFPDKEYQAKFLKHMHTSFKNLPWMISVDAADSDYSPLEDNEELLALNFGVFDDSFLCKQHANENAVNWKILGEDRWKRSPGGGEFSYYNNRDQKMALSPAGPNGVSFEQSASQFHITFMIGDGQPKFQKEERLAQAGKTIGYKFRITNAQRQNEKVRLEVTNAGIAPIYRDAYFANGNTRSPVSLKWLLPGEKRVIVLDDSQGNLATTLNIQCDYLVPGQQIQFESEL